jgi:hypothetical protein
MKNLYLLIVICFNVLSIFIFSDGFILVMFFKANFKLIKKVLKLGIIFNYLCKIFLTSKVFYL